jgi:hypothetical protein
MTRLRAHAYLLLDKAISIETDGAFGLDDLPDTPMVMNALSDIQGILRTGYHSEGATASVRWARDIIEDEGELFFD